MMMHCDLHNVSIDRRGCPWCELEQLSEQLSACNDARKNAEETIEAMKVQGQNFRNLHKTIREGHFGHGQGCDCAVCDDIDFRRSLPAKCFIDNDGVTDCDKLRAELEKMTTTNYTVLMQQYRDKIASLSHELDDMRQNVNIAYDVGEGRAEQNIEPIKQLAYAMGRNSLKAELIDWLTNGFEYENSVMTVHAVRETINRFTLADRL